MEQLKEVPAFKVSGFVVLGLLLIPASFGIWQVWRGREVVGAPLIVGASLLALTALVAVGLFTVEPNQARVIVFFGRYIGSVREAGLWWANPLATKQRVSLRVRNFNSKILKVNDALGNPIEIGAVVVWRVVDSAKSLFAVNDYEGFVAIQSETAIRAFAIRYPYDAPDEDIPSLRGVPEEIANALQKEVQARLEVAGVEVLEARLSHLAYAPEIAQAMLRRQQARAIIDARRQIVEGAVGMVDEALRRLSEQQIIELDEERKAAMINNLLVVLTSDQNTQPVVNTGSLYT